MKLFKQVLCFLCCILILNPGSVFAGPPKGNGPKNDDTQGKPSARPRPFARRVALPPAPDNGVEDSLVSVTHRLSTPSSAGSESSAKVSPTRHWPTGLYETGPQSSHLQKRGPQRVWGPTYDTGDTGAGSDDTYATASSSSGGDSEQGGAESPSRRFPRGSSLGSSQGSSSSADTPLPPTNRLPWIHRVPRALVLSFFLKNKVGETFLVMNPLASSPRNSFHIPRFRRSGVSRDPHLDQEYTYVESRVQRSLPDAGYLDVTPEEKNGSTTQPVYDIGNADEKKGEGEDVVYDLGTADYADENVYALASETSKVNGVGTEFGFVSSRSARAPQPPLVPRRFWVTPMPVGETGDDDTEDGFGFGPSEEASIPGMPGGMYEEPQSVQREIYYATAGRKPTSQGSSNLPVYAIPFTTPTVESETDVYLVPDPRQSQLYASRASGAFSGADVYEVPDHRQPQIYDTAMSEALPDPDLKSFSSSRRLFLQGTFTPLSEEQGREKLRRVLEGVNTFWTVALWEIGVCSLAAGGAGIARGGSVPDVLVLLLTGSGARDVYDLGNSSYPAAAVLSLLGVIPPVVGLVKGLRTAPLSDEAFRLSVAQALDVLRQSSSRGWREWLWIRPFLTPKQKALRKVRSALWDNRLIHPDKIVEALIDFVTTHRGLTSMEAQNILMMVAGLSPRDVDSGSEPFAQGVALSFLRKRAKLGGVAGLHASSCLSFLGHSSPVKTIAWTAASGLPYGLALLMAHTLFRTMSDLLTSPSSGFPKSADVLGNGSNSSSSTPSSSSSSSSQTPSPTSSPEASSLSTPLTSSSSSTALNPITSPKPTSSSQTPSVPTVASSSPVPSTPEVSSALPLDTSTISSSPHVSSSLASSTLSPDVSPSSALSSPSPTPTPASSSPTPVLASSTSHVPTTPPFVTTTQKASTTITLSPQEITQRCLDQMIRNFLAIPGRPLGPLLDALSGYVLPEGKTPFTLNLSETMPNATYAAELITGIRNRLPDLLINEVDLSGVFYPGTGLDIVLGVLPNTFETLDLATPTKDDVPYTPPAGSFFGADRFPNLRKVDLSGINRFFGNEPRFLATVRFLLNAPQLEKISIQFVNGAFGSSDRGPYFPQLMEALGNMSNLTLLDLTQGGISRLTKQTIYLAETIGNWTNLQELKLDHNSLGNDPEGLRQLVRNLPQSLRVLSLENNAVGKYDSSILVELTEKLLNLPHLTHLNLRWSYLFSNITTLEQQMAFANALPQGLEHLEVMVPSSESIPPAWQVRERLRERFSNISGDINALCNATEVREYFAQFNGTQLHLPRHIPLVSEVIEALAQELPRHQQIVNLNLAENTFEAGRETWVSETLAPSVGQLLNLRNLNISGNFIRQLGNSQILGNTWNVDVNPLFTNAGAEAWLRAISNLTLSELDISGARWGGNGYFSDGRSIGALNQTLLDAAFGHSRLRVLVAENSQIQVTDNIFRAITPHLPTSVLKLDGNSLGGNRGTDNAPLQIFFETIGNSSLEQLYISDNRIGQDFCVPPYATHLHHLARALSNLPSLDRLFIDHNPAVLTSSGTFCANGRSDIDGVLGNLTESVQQVVFAGLLPSEGYWASAGNKWDNFTLRGLDAQCPSYIVERFAEILQNASSSQPGRRSLEPQAGSSGGSGFFPGAEAFEFEPVTSSASRPMPPYVLTILPEVLSRLYSTGQSLFFGSFLNSPGLQPDLPVFVGKNSSFALNACVPDSFERPCEFATNGSSCAVPSGSKKLSSDEVRVSPPDVESMMIMALLGFHQAKKAISWWRTPKEEPTPTVFASRRMASDQIRKARHSLRKISNALKALETVDSPRKDVKILEHYREAFEMHSVTLDRLENLKKQPKTQDSSSSLIPQEELERLSSDCKILLGDIEEDIELRFMELKNGRWVINYLPEAERQKEMTRLSERLTQVKRDMETMYDLLGTRDSLDPYIPLFEEIKSSLDAFETQRSLPRKALTQLNEQMKNLEELLQKERVFQFIEDTNGTLTLDQLPLERAQERIDSLREQFVKCNDAFDFMQIHRILPQKTLDKGNTHVESLLGGLDRFITLLEKGSRESERSFVPTKGLDQLQEGLTALEKWMLQYMEFTDNAWDGKLLSSEEGRQRVAKSHGLLTNCQLAMHSLRNSEKLSPEAGLQAESALQGFKDTHEHLTSLLEAKEETDEGEVKHFPLPQKVLDAHTQAMQIFLNGARQALSL